MNKLFILYDAQNEFALRCRHWLGDNPSFLPLEFIPFQSPELLAKIPGVEAYKSSHHLLVVSNEGAVYAGPQAFIMCLYALEKYRDWAGRLSTPELLPFAAGALDIFAAHGGTIPRWLDDLDDAELAELLRLNQTPLKSNYKSDTVEFTRRPKS